MRRTSLKRKTRIKPKRARRVYMETKGFAFPKPAGRRYDDGHRAAVLTLPCLLRDDPEHVCDGRTQGDHAGKRPMGRKSDDDEEISLCPSAHRQRQTYTGWCAGLDKHGMRLVMTTAIAETQARLGYRQAA